MQRAAGLYGSLIVDAADGEAEPFRYDGEFNLLLSDWYHQSIYDQTVGLSSKPFRWIGEPQVNNALATYRRNPPPVIQVLGIETTKSKLKRLWGPTNSKQCATVIRLLTRKGCGGPCPGFGCLVQPSNSHHLFFDRRNL